MVQSDHNWTAQPKPDNLQHLTCHTKQHQQCRASHHFHPTVATVVSHWKMKPKSPTTNCCWSNSWHTEGKFLDWSHLCDGRLQWHLWMLILHHRQNMQPNKCDRCLPRDAPRHVELPCSCKRKKQNWPHPNIKQFSKTNKCPVQPIQRNTSLRPQSHVCGHRQSHLCQCTENCTTDKEDNQFWLPRHSKICVPHLWSPPQQQGLSKRTRTSQCKRAKGNNQPCQHHWQSTTTGYWFCIETLHKTWMTTMLRKITPDIQDPLLLEDLWIWGKDGNLNGKLTYHTAKSAAPQTTQTWTKHHQSRTQERKKRHCKRSATTPHTKERNSCCNCENSLQAENTHNKPTQTLCMLSNAWTTKHETTTH